MGAADEAVPFKGAWHELMAVTISLCKAHGMTPFEIFREDTDEVISVINFYIEKGEEEPRPTNQGKKQETRIRVNDKTATGGWF